MKSISRRALVLYSIILLFLAGCGLLFFNLISHSEEWAMNKANKHLYNSGSLATAGDILDVNGEILVTTKNGSRSYNDDKSIRIATLHTVGDSSGYIASGVQSAFKNEITGYSLKDGVYNLQRYGKGNDITLTLNAEICKVAYNALGNYKGTVGVMNYKTGELICIVSTPSFDVYNKPKDIHTDTSGKYEGIYMNRFFSGLYTPGSTFKIVTAACAVENIPDIYEKEFVCNGKIQVGEGYVICSATHGKINFEEALNKSCNCAFAKIAEEVGNEALTRTAERIGFNGLGFVINDKINCSNSKLDLSNAKLLDLGWAGIGQYTTLINPCQMLTAISSIANKGFAVSPYLVSQIQTPNGREILKGETIELGQYFTEMVADELNVLLRSNVKNRYGDNLFPGIEMCGKTGTAEISDNSEAKPNGLFVGYSQREDMPFAIIVIVENTNSSMSSAVPIASKVMKAIKNEYTQ
ncbi:MAG: penicillin-binding protein [Clostridia bacterium]|nr:penicillin-binding protein [Clostridia bacterium]